MQYRYEVKQEEKGKYKFKSSRISNSLIKVYLITDLSDKKGFEIFTTNKNEFTINLKNLESRAYFMLQHDGLEYIIAERTLRIDGMNNFRDMGGYETYNNKYVKWGLLYRSDHIYNAKDKGLDYLRTLNINTIIDYRSVNEIKKYPNRIINNTSKTYNFDPNAHTAELSAQFTSSKKNEDLNLINKIIEQNRSGKLLNRYDIVMEQYHNFVTKPECQKAFSNMLRILSMPTSPASVQHCRGGKDRTGYGAMLLLGTLGVKKEYLIYDYMLTHYNRINRNEEKMDGYRKLTQDKNILNYLYSLIETKPEFIEKSYDNIISNYHSIENYVRQALGITNEEINSLKSLYLE